MARPTLQPRLGKLLKGVRLAASKTQEEVAHEAGISTTYLSYIERGTREPTLAVVLAVARSIGTPACDLISELEKNP